MAIQVFDIDGMKIRMVLTIEWNAKCVKLLMELLKILLTHLKCEVGYSWVFIRWSFRIFCGKKCNPGFMRQHKDGMRSPFRQLLLG